jgi:serine/threonine protein phosphatase PrpC
VVVDGASARLVHLGDSRVYLLRGERLARLTRDHTVARELVELQRISAAEAEVHPLRGMLSRFVGSTADAEPDVAALSLAAGDWLLLATDGLTAVLQEADLLPLCRMEQPRGPEGVCRRLVAEALARHPPDNVTVIAVAALAAGNPA